jgi:hypothetical protein
MDAQAMKITPCRSCKAPLVWLKTASGKNMPLDADWYAQRFDIDDDAPAFDYKTHHEGVHWATCPHAIEHRRDR